MELSPRKIEIAQMDRERLNELYYLALEKLDKMTRDNNILLTLVDELEVHFRDVINKERIKEMKQKNISDPRLETSIPNLSESMVMVTPEKQQQLWNSPKKTGIISRKNKNWSINIPETPETPNIFYQHLGKPSYREQFLANTPPRKTTTTSRKGSQGGKRDKNNRKNKTMRKYLKK